VDASAVLKRSDDVTFEVVADEAILIRLDTGTYFSLNKVGTEFWQMIDGLHSIEEQARSIADKYGVEPPMVVSDLLELAEEMAKEDLVQVASGK
jgi:hypothetical protein